MKQFLIGFLIVVTFGLSCSSPPYSHMAKTTDEHLSNNLQRDSFVQIRSKVSIRSCAAGLCVTRTERFVGSGFVVKKTSNGSFIMTAGHICHDPRESATHVLSHIVVDLSGEIYEAISLIRDLENDMCLMHAKGLTNRPPIPLARRAPEPGEKLYNLAAPAGIFGVNMVPIIHGHYNGEDEGRAIYSVPAAGGSSGSVVLNSNFEVVGMIHSVHMRFPVITIGPTFKKLKDFIDQNTKRFSNL